MIFKVEMDESEYNRLSIAADVQEVSLEELIYNSMLDGIEEAFRKKRSKNKKEPKTLTLFNEGMSI